jgi:hypothetical protein
MCVRCGRDFIPCNHSPRKGAEQCQESPRPNGPPLVRRVNPDAAEVTRLNRAARSKTNPRINATKSVWRWRKNSQVHSVGCASGGESDDGPWSSTRANSRDPRQPLFGARQCRAATNAACAGVGKRGTSLSCGNSRKRTKMIPLFAAHGGRALPHWLSPPRSPSVCCASFIPPNHSLPRLA